MADQNERVGADETSDGVSGATADALLTEAGPPRGEADRDEATRQRAARRDDLRRALADVERFGETILGMPLRPYQAEVARAVLASIAEGRGHTLTVQMPRQSGKNQLAATRP